MIRKLVEMHDMFGSLYPPIPIFDIPYAVMNRIVYEVGLLPVELGGWSSLLLLAESVGDFTTNNMLDIHRKLSIVQRINDACLWSLLLFMHRTN